MEKKRFFANHAKSSAMLISLAIHALLIIVAISFVAVKIIVKEDQTFIADQRVKRPKMPPKKIQVPVETKKKQPKPRLRKRIVSERKIADIKMPEITGVKGGLGNMGGDGLDSLGFGMDIGVFGGDKYMGNELTGTFFDFKQTKDGKPTDVGKKYKWADPYPMIDAFYYELAKFASGWNPNRLKEFYQAPKNKYATCFMIPTVHSGEATKAFGVADTVTPGCWAAYYTGHITAPETGKYRFWGYGDDVLLVRVKKRLVLDAGFEPYRPKLKTGWESDDDKNNRKYPINPNPAKPLETLLYTGDWVYLVKGEAVKMEVLIADVGGTGPGATCSSFLLIEQQDAQYKMVPYSYKNPDTGEMVTGTRPVLPVFKTTEIPQDLKGKMKINPNEATIEGPSFGSME